MDADEVPEINYRWWIEYARSPAFRDRCERIVRHLGEARGEEYIAGVTSEYRALALSNEFFAWADEHIREAHAAAGAGETGGRDDAGKDGRARGGSPQGLPFGG